MNKKINYTIIFYILHINVLITVILLSSFKTQYQYMCLYKHKEFNYSVIEMSRSHCINVEQKSIINSDVRKFSLSCTLLLFYWKLQEKTLSYNHHLRACGLSPSFIVHAFLHSLNRVGLLRFIAICLFLEASRKYA